MFICAICDLYFPDFVFLGPLFIQFFTFSFFLWESNRQATLVWQHTIFDFRWTTWIVSVRYFTSTLVYCEALNIWYSHSLFFPQTPLITVTTRSAVPKLVFLLVINNLLLRDFCNISLFLPIIFLFVAS